ncbi:AzlC family ABC transporter permease [Rhodobacter sp. KR11]|uniref:AzlC family ABC transporter permease n=1 Tax=Rhodobacter sp. KR11 TaxID=2974588 RepID=UPI0022225261|nr:AzlC family ABC transporter permease [Rhodobacter sp. KR11]MCW1918450.1 AzlC family ABC transporter permease [Rhodobacter sp. KR11]
MERSGIRAGLAEAVPLMLGYFPIAFSFGVAATRSGMTGWEAMALSVIVFAGAAQFLAIALVASGTPVILAGLTLAAMNLRHLLYGPVVLQKAGAMDKGAGGSRRFAWAWSFALTDEVFGAALGALARGQRFSEGFMGALGFAAYGAWVAGTAAGAWAGGGALDGFPALAAGLDFMLPGLFLALLLSILSGAQVPVILVAGLATVAGTWAVSGTVGLFAGMISGAVLGVMSPSLMRRGQDAK